MKKSILFPLLVYLFAHSSLIHADDRLGYVERALRVVQNEVAEITRVINALPKPTNYTAGEGIAINNGVIQSTTAHHLGELYHGGIVFFVDETGQHGLVASLGDVNKGQGVSWRNGDSGNRVTNARADGIFAGESNTRLIISQQTIDYHAGLFAALIAANYRVSADGQTPCPMPPTQEILCYGNWYLPSAFELQLLNNNIRQANLVAFEPEFYWSSTEVNVSNAWLINFATGELQASSKSNTVGRVRAISRF